MRYTEIKYDLHAKNVYDLIRIFFILVLIAPIRLLNEISSKIVYVEKEIIERIFITAIIMNTSVLMINFLWYAYKKKLSLVGTSIPLIALFFSLLLLAVLYYVLLVRPVRYWQFASYARVLSNYTENDESTIVGSNVVKEIDVKTEPIVIEDSAPLSSQTGDKDSIDKEEKDTDNNLELQLDLNSIVNKICNEDIHNFQGTLREDEFLESRKNLDKAVQEDKYNLQSTLNQYIDNDILPEDFDIDFSESESQSLFLGVN